jgi:hypothetical protein
MTLNRFFGRGSSAILFLFLLKKNIFLADAFISPFSTHKQCILPMSIEHNSIAMTS